ncbi:MAG: discoidin domain-containing protein [Clostridia bacterium]|nr:discoidin domain-containing protein [Clostridia bacterium]
MKKILSLFLSVAIFATLLMFPITSRAVYIPTLTIDMSAKTGALRHGSSGFLYGLGSDGTPSANTLTPLKPSTAVQKAPDGLQHPTGDVLDVAGTFISAGGEQVQIYLQDIYALWPYEQASFEDYLSHIEEMVPKIVALRNSNPDYHGKLVYVPFNEPDGIWYGNIGSSASVQATFNSHWLQAYNLIHSLDPDALIGGISCANYLSGAYEAWIKFCTENDCEPDYITWHELQDYDLNSFAANLASYRAIEAKYGMEEREIIINEYAPQDHCSNPGKLVNWIALFEENKVSGCLPYWHNAGNLNDIAADNNEPNGAWWLYKWYGDMSGETLSLTTNTARTEFYGLASIDDNKKSASVIFGGNEGDASIVLQNIADTIPFDGAEFVDIEVKATYWTAFHGVSEEPRTIIRGTYSVIDNTVTVTIPSMEENAAYLVTVSPSQSEEAIIYYGAERKLYEAEGGTHVGAAYANNVRWTYAYSGGYRLSGIQSENDGFNLPIEVEHTGYYRMDLTYANGHGTNPADPSANNPQSLSATIRFDRDSAELITLENTLRDEMAGMYTTYVYLAKGNHTMQLRGVETNGGAFSCDSIAFTYVGGTIPQFDSVYEAELGDFNLLKNNQDTTLTTESTISGYSGSGYITGLEGRSVEVGGGVRFTVVVPDNALYTIALRYSAEADSTANIYLDNTALDLDNVLTDISLPATDSFETEYVTAFLQKGINIIDIDASAPIALDYMRVKKAEGDPIAVEAEAGVLSGEAEECENPYASRTQYVSNIEGGTEDALTLSVNAPNAGKYKMVIHHSSGELFGGHTYNAQLVDRYASFKLNETEAKRLYFKNTYSDSNWRTTVLEVELTEGDNTLKVFNDNWRLVKNGTGSTGNITYNTLVNYTPNFDLFEFYPSVTENSSLAESFKMSLMATSHGTAELDKTALSPNEEVTLTLNPEYNEGRIVVTANGEDISYLISGNTLTYAPTTDTEFLVSFIIPENLDNYITNSSFGTGDSTGWDAEDTIIITDGNIHYASIGTISQSIACEKDFYDITFKAKGESVTVTANDYTRTITLSDTWQTYSVRTHAESEINLSLTGTAFVDEFALNKGSVDPEVLYFVDCGDVDPETINSGDKYGLYNSVTEQFYQEDAVTGYSWGIVDEYVPNETYPHLLTGAETWPYEYDLADGTDKVITYRYAKDQDDRTGNGITYKFALPEDGDYAFEVAFYAPSHWMGVNRKSSLTMNGEVLASGIIPRSNEYHPVTVRKIATVTGGEATLNLKLDSDGTGGPMISYIKIYKAATVLPKTKLDVADFTVTCSDTWNSDPNTHGKYAFDGNTQTFFDGISGGYLVVDLGYETTVSAIGYYPREGWNTRMEATHFSASRDGVTWEKLFVIPSAPQAGVETIVSSNEFMADGIFRYIKYENPYDYCNVAEINIYKETDSFQFVSLDEDVCKLESITLENGTYSLSFTEGSSGTIIQSEVVDGTLSFVKSSGLTDTLEQISPTEKLYVWDKENIKPLVLIKR